MTSSDTRYRLTVAGPLSRTATQLIDARFGPAASIGSTGTDSTVELVADQSALRALLTLLWDLGHELNAVGPVSPPGHSHAPTTSGTARREPGRLTG
jgi:hypothetical protein